MQAVPPATADRAKRIERANEMIAMVAAPAMAIPALRADAATLLVYGEPLVDCVADLAEEDPRIARIWNRITNSGGYAKLLATAVIMGTQLAANHGVKLLQGLPFVHTPDVMITLAAQMGGDNVEPPDGSGGKTG